MLITQTPLRISLVGGGSDIPVFFQDDYGAVVSCAIDKFIYVVLNQRFDDKIYINYSKKEIVDSVDEIQHELIREAMRKAGVSKALEIAIMADIPSEGSGLGSSSSLTVGLLNAFYTYKGEQVTASRLAEEACEIEIGLCGKPIGKQDQYIAAYGGLRYFKFLSDGSVEVEDLSLGQQRLKFGAGMLLFYTNITRKSEVILKEQGDNIAHNRRHVAAIRDLATAARSALLSSQYDEIGNLLDRNWKLKKKLASGISRPEIDEMVEVAMSSGALGCKVCGAGGGGFLLVYCPPDLQQELRLKMRAYREIPFFLEKCGSKVIFNVERYDWR